MKMQGKMKRIPAKGVAVYNMETNMEDASNFPTRNRSGM